MMELIQESLRMVNLPFTVLAGLTMVYWVMVVLGVLDVEAFDLELDLEPDLDLAADVDADAAGLAGTPFASLLAILGLGDVPIMLSLSVFFLSAWALSVTGNHYLNPEQAGGVSALIVLGTLAVSVILMWVITRPFGKPYKLFRKDYDAPQRVVGSVCRVTSIEIGARVGSREGEAKRVQT